MRSQEVHVTVGTASVQVLPPNPKRVSIFLSGDGVNTLTLSFLSPVVAGAGIVLTPTNPVFHIRYGEAGSNITSALYAVASAAGAKLTIIEGFT